MNEIFVVSLVGLATTSSAMAGTTAIGLYWPLSKRSLACILAFAAGALISALAIDLAYQGAVHLHHAGFSQHSSWAFIGGGSSVAFFSDALAGGAVLALVAHAMIPRHSAEPARSLYFPPWQAFSLHYTSH
jgi:hypothetical protein